MNNNWHIKIADCNEAQRRVIAKVYGGYSLRLYAMGFENDQLIFLTSEPLGGDLPLITPEQAFERLELSVASHGDRSFQQEYFQAEQKIKDLEQQLADKLLDVDWGKAPEDATSVGQSGRSICWLKGKLVWNTSSGTWINSLRKTEYTILATRPKPKLTSEQIAAAKAYDEWLNRNSGDFECDCFEEWLKEVGHD